MKKILLIASVLFTMTACSIEDEGNYSYSELNSVTIEDIENGYSKLSKLDNLTITPKLSGSINGDKLDNYEFHWFICTGLHEHTTISTEKDLDWKVDLPAGSYTIYFSVKDKTTGLEWIENTTLAVTTSYTKGFLLLGDDENGEARMDMIVMPSGRDTVVAERVYANPQQARNAQRIFFTGPRQANGSPDSRQSLWLVAEDHSMKLTSSTSLEAEKDYPEFTNIGILEELGILEPQVEIKTPIEIKDVFPHPIYMSRAASSRGMITEDLITVNNLYQPEYYNSVINRYSSTSKELFKPYPLAFMRGAYMRAVDCIFYDMDANQFVKINNNMYMSATNCTKLTYDYDGDPFKWNAGAEGRTIVYGENGFDSNQGDSYAIMKDGDNNYFIYRFLVQSSNYSAPTKKGNYPVDLSMATGFDKASHYAFSSAKTVVLYSVGSTLYAYDYSRQQFTSKDLGAEITFLEAEYASSMSTSDIMIATFDDATQKGTVRKVTIGGGNNAVEIIEKPKEIWDVTLKVKDIEWKNSI